ncbi:hypothetical protein DSO57_1004285 [Entomophthora muscae]|uniref:Uncharacterized protein n=1 Tax=Entomophthora muscae TaxID=34485 RepID=A0ACC2RZF4_9FUNG|nr:hypothetical protein DSO57_1004285 [Entomophthora muscae]
MYYEQEEPVDQRTSHDDSNQRQELEKAKRRELTIKYRTLIKKYEDLKQAPEENTFEVLPAGVDEANTLFADVKGTYEASLDSKVLILTSELGIKHAQNLRIDGSVFDRNKYFICLQKYAEALPSSSYNSSSSRARACPVNWNKLGALATKAMNRVPTTDFMLGPLNIKSRIRKRMTKVREAAVVTKVVRPQQVVQSDLNMQENDTTANVQMLYSLIEKNGPYKLFEFVINPYSFGQSVENLFYLSFLIRDGKARITNQNGELVLDRATPPTQDDFSSGVQKKQIVMELDSFVWAKLIKMYKIESPIIPDRSPTSSISSTSFQQYR